MLYEGAIRFLNIAKQKLSEGDYALKGVYIGKAQEQAQVFRTIHQKHPHTGKSMPWISRGTALPNHYYFYLLDEDFGPLFIKYRRGGSPMAGAFTSSLPARGSRRRLSL